MEWDFISVDLKKLKHRLNKVQLKQFLGTGSCLRTVGIGSKEANCQGFVRNLDHVSNTRDINTQLLDGGVADAAYKCTGARQNDRCKCFNVRLMWR